MKFQIKNRWSGAVQFECELGVEFESQPYSLQIGAAVKLAIKQKANLSYSDLSYSNLSYSNLSYSNLSGSNLRGSDLSYSNFSGSNLRGSDLSYSNLRGSDLSYSDLSYSNLRGSDLSYSDLSYSDLSYSNLRGSDLSYSDLSYSNFSGSNLSGSDLSYSNLRGSNLRGSNLSGVPKIKNIHQSIYAAASQPNALNMSTWHTCETTHCRAGWAVHLAGAAGAAMEFCLGASPAAALIYLASDPTLEKIPDFHCDNEAALADMKRLAELEAAAIAKAKGE